MKFVDKRYKNNLDRTIGSQSDGRDVPSARFIRAVITLKYGTCTDVIRWTLSPFDPRTTFQRAINSTHCVSPRHLHLKYYVDFSLTQEK